MDILSARKKAGKAGAKKKAAVAPMTEAEASAGAIEQAAAESAPSSEHDAAPLVPASLDAESGSEAAGSVSAKREMLGFRLGGEEYAVEIEKVREVTRLWGITPVPNSPEYILGVTSLRGSVLPVMDLCKRLNIQPGERDEKSRIIVVEVGGENIGIAADRVTGVLHISEEEIDPAPETIEDGAEYLAGIARKGGNLYILLDIEKAAGK